MILLILKRCGSLLVSGRHLGFVPRYLCRDVRALLAARCLARRLLPRALARRVGAGGSSVLSTKAPLRPVATDFLFFGLGYLFGLSGPFVGVFLGQQALNSFYVSRIREALDLSATLSATMPAQKLAEVLLPAGVVPCLHLLHGFIATQDSSGSHR